MSYAPQLNQLVKKNSHQLSSVDGGLKEGIGTGERYSHLGRVFTQSGCQNHAEQEAAVLAGF